LLRKQWQHGAWLSGKHLGIQVGWQTSLQASQLSIPCYLCAAAVSTATTGAALQEIFWCCGFTDRTTDILVCVGELGGLQLSFRLVPWIEQDIRVH